MDGGYYNGKWHTETFLEYAHELENAFRDADEWLIERIFARLENDADITLEEYLELCEIGRPQE